MQHLIPFRPLFNLIYILVKFGGMHWKKVPSLAPWLLKTIVFEPIRWIEALYFALKRPQKKLENPIFVLGFYRSGTTWLQQLLNTDTDFATPSLFQTVAPEFMFLLEPTLKPLLQFISNHSKQTNPYHRLPFDWDFPGEEDVAINALSYLSDFNRVYQYPSYAEKILNQHFGENALTNQKAWINAHQYFVDKIRLKNKGKRLILKSPPNTARIALLKKAYPHAKFIFLKRKQETCIPSYLRLWAINEAFIFENCSVQQRKEVASLLYQSIHHQYEQQKNALDKNELIEIQYEDFIDDPMGTVDQVYNKFNLKDDEQKRSMRQALINQRSDYQPIVYDH